MSFEDITEKEVDTYIETNVLRSEVYDSASDKQKTKAFNQSKITLPDFLETEDITVRDVAEQVVFLFMIDNTLQRAELGVNFVTVDGVQIQIADKDRTLAPSIMKRHNIQSTQPSRVGSYTTRLRDTFRYGHGGY